MKKALLITLVLAITLLSFVSCTSVDNTTVNIGYMSGPTGMGMAKLISDNGGVAGNEKYTFTSFDNTNMALTKLISGDVDIICLPTNEAASFYNKGNTGISVLAINTLGTLYLVSNENYTFENLSDLNGKTIYTCKNGTPRMILENLLDAYDIDAEVSYTVGETEMSAPKDLAAQVMAGNIDIAVAPEPIITNIVSKKANFSIDIDLSDAWSEKYGSDLAMGCIVARNEFIDGHKSLVNSFLAEYKSSIQYISNQANLETSSQYVADAAIIDTKKKASMALSNLGDAISYIDGDEMKETLESFYNAIGISLPSDTFYYEK